MQTAEQIFSDAQLARASPASRRVMVVDDSAAQRKVLALSLARWGYSVTEAASGEAALALCEMASFDLVLSDWMMPGMSGLDLCRALRATPRDNYLYFILLTSKSDKTEVADGLDGGADDFLSKPVNALELRARLRAGERLLAMQEELVEKNRLVASTLGELQTIYDSLDRDLIEARKLQQTLMRDRHCDFGSASVWALLRPSGHVGGDLVGWLRLSRSRVALYAVDVSGHGVASAMMTARLAGLLTTRTPYEMPDRRAAPSPDRLAEVLNRMMIDDMQIDQYFTMAYAEVDLKTGEVQLVQAGHPHPVILRRTGQTEEIGQGGLPVGLIADARYEIVEARLQPGDRLFLVSDGVTECVDQQGHEFGEEGLSSMLQRSVALGGAALLEALVWDLQEFSGGADFRDDVSGVLFEYRGA